MLADLFFDCLTNRLWVVCNSNPCVNFCQFVCQWVNNVIVKIVIVADWCGNCVANCFVNCVGNLLLTGCNLCVHCVSNTCAVNCFVNHHIMNFNSRVNCCQFGWKLFQQLIIGCVHFMCQLSVNSNHSCWLIEYRFVWIAVSTVWTLMCQLSGHLVVICLAFVRVFVNWFVNCFVI